MSSVTIDREILEGLIECADDVALGYRQRALATEKAARVAQAARNAEVTRWSGVEEPADEGEFVSPF